MAVLVVKKGRIELGVEVLLWSHCWRFHLMLGGLEWSQTPRVDLVRGQKLNGVVEVGAAGIISAWNTPIWFTTCSSDLRHATQGCSNVCSWRSRVVGLLTTATRRGCSGGARRDQREWSGGARGDLLTATTVRLRTAGSFPDSWIQAWTWAWTLLLGFRLIYFISVLSGLFYLVFTYLLLSIKRCGLCLGLRILHTMSILGGRRVFCFVKWSQPPSGRMKFSVTGTIFQWQHSRKAVRHSNLWLCMSIVFPVCRQICKTNGVANDALLVKWCLLECIGLKTPDMILGCLGNLGFRLYVPPLYSAVSLMVKA